MKKKKGGDMLGGLFITTVGISIFLISLFSDCPLIIEYQYPVSRVGMIISAIGMFMILRKIFKNI